VLLFMVVGLVGGLSWLWGFVGVCGGLVVWCLERLSLEGVDGLGGAGLCEKFSI
jgi:hypothetical protein